ncbi:MAG TPA: ketoacyl-ACP synthase III, partial [Bacteroidia bacterium]|nr:ketoacyl-ACP synthase III [Bacteroidia bacterium]
MAFFPIENINLVGIAAAVPQCEVSNWDYDYISQQERKLLIKTTGIEKRRAVKDSGITTSDLCMAAAEKLLKETSTSKEDIEIIV